jgi:hypothetical protein
VTEALSWYERAQKQAPNGVYAAEACAGKMRMLLQTGGPTAARPAAELYLARFPNGVHAAAAEKIVASTSKP